MPHRPGPGARRWPLRKPTAGGKKQRPFLRGRYGNCPGASPRGWGKDKDPALSPGLRRQVGHRRRSRLAAWEDAGWERRAGGSPGAGAARYRWLAVGDAVRIVSPRGWPFPGICPLLRAVNSPLGEPRSRAGVWAGVVAGPSFTGSRRSRPAWC